MSLVVLEAAVSNLLVCAPAASSAPRLDREIEAEALIASAIRFAVALEKAGFGEELRTRGKLLPTLMGDVEDARKSAHAAIMARLQPDAKQHKNAGLDWRAYLWNLWFEDEDLVKIAALLNDPALPTMRAKAQAFVERGFGSRATFFRKARILRAA